jgi:hypothetical protein
VTFFTLKFLLKNQIQVQSFLLDYALKAKLHGVQVVIDIKQTDVAGGMLDQAEEKKNLMVQLTEQEIQLDVVMIRKPSLCSLQRTEYSFPHILCNY